MNVLVAFLALASCFPAHADGGDVAWAPIVGLRAVPHRVRLDDPAFYQVHLPVEQLQGRWVRISGRFQGEPGEARATILAFAGKRRLSYAPPATCRGEASDRVCEAFAWIPRETDLLKATVWSAVTPTTVSELHYEVGAVGRPNPEAALRLDALLKTMAELYYRSAEVNWSEIRRSVDPALAAPRGIDPIPGIVASVLTALPGGRHNGMRLKLPHERSEQEERLIQEADDSMPTCHSVKDNIHLLDLPGTPRSSPEAEVLYVEAAQQCLLAQPRQTRWIVDLRNCSGGTSHLTIAALSALLPAGELLQWQNGHGDRIPVDLTAAGVKTGGRFSLAHVLPVGQRATAPALVWIGPGTGSACEALAAALSTRARTRLVGLPSAGLATGNETIEISSDHLVFLTAGRMLVGGQPLEDDRLVPRAAVGDLSEGDLATMLEQE